DGGGAVVGRDARRRAVAVVDRHGERGALALGVVGDHQGQTELVAAFARQRRADESRRVRQEERDLLGGGRLRGHDQVALVLAVFVVDHDDDLAPPDGADDVLDASQWHGYDLSSRSRSTYLAIMSTSRFTRSPADLRPKVVTAAVWGMTATVKPSSRTSTTVRLHPSTVMDPFTTT